jgi:hypothetical protein
MFPEDGKLLPKHVGNANLTFKEDVKTDGQPNRM